MDITHFTDLEFVRCLNKDEYSTSILFKYKDEDGVLTISKQQWNDEEIKKIFSNQEAINKVIMDENNDIYYKHTAKVNPGINDLKLSSVFPASEEVINKATSCRTFIIEESYEKYQKLVAPFINDLPKSKIQWVYNIFNHTAEESKRIEYESDSFVLLPDFCWEDLSNTERIYLLAIVKDKNLRSIRDLNGSHLPILYEIKKQVTNCLENTFKQNMNEISMFFHYHPSFYQLHLHITKKDNIDCHHSRYHPLSQVIQNIELVEDYYQKATLHYTIDENSKLYLALQNNEVVVL